MQLSILCRLLFLCQPLCDNLEFLLVLFSARVVWDDLKTVSVANELIIFRVVNDRPVFILQQLIFVCRVTYNSELLAEICGRLTEDSFESLGGHLDVLVDSVENIADLVAVDMREQLEEVGKLLLVLLLTRSLHII